MSDVVAIQAQADEAQTDLAERRHAESEIIAAEAGEPVAEPIPDALPEDKPFSSLVPLIIGCAMLMQTLNATVLSNALPHMARDLHESPITLNLAITSYMLASAVFLPISAWAADRFGARRIFTLAIILFAASSAACGLAQNLTHLVIARLFQGMAGAMMMPVGRLILLRTTPKHDLVRAMSVLTMPAMLGPVIGPPLGGAVVTFGDWRWIFFFNVPIALLGVFLVTRFIKEVKEVEAPPLDWVGSALVGLGLAGMIYGLESLRGTHIGIAVLGPAIAGAICLILYTFHAKRTPHAVLDLSLLRNATFHASVVGGAFMRMGMGATPFLLALLLQIGFGLSPFQAGMMTFASAAAALVMKTAAPPILAYFGFKKVLTVNAVIVGCSFMAYAFFTPQTPYALIVGVLIIGGFFRSLQFTSLNGLAFADVEQSQMSRASSMSTMGQQLAQTIGVSLAAVLLHAFMANAHQTHPTTATIAPAFFAVGLLTFVSVLFFIPLKADAGSELHGTGGRRPRTA